MAWKALFGLKHFQVAVNVGATPGNGKALFTVGGEWVDHTLVHGDVSDFDTGVQSNRLDQMAAPTAAVDINSQNLTNVAAGTTSGHAVEYDQWQASQAGLTWKEPVRAASVANVVLASGLENADTIDGVTLDTGDRVLLKNQTATSENGIYVVVASGAASRAADMNTWDEHVSAATFVSEGTVNADAGYVFTVDAGGVLETTAIAAVQFNGAANITAGDGITKTGNTLDLDFASETEDSAPADTDWFLFENNAGGTFYKVQKSDLLAGAVPGAHASTHERGSTDSLNGDQLGIDWNPTYYTPATTPTESDHIDDLTAHLYGIDQAFNGKQPLDADLTSWALLTRASGFDVLTETPSLANLNTLITDATLVDTGDSRFTDSRTPLAHDLGGGEHNADTLANLNSKVSDATLIDTADGRLTDARTPLAHDLGGGEHNVDTLANLNTKISDATLIDTADARLSDDRDPTAHATTHKSAGADPLLLNEFGAPTGAVDVNDQQLQDVVIHTVADQTALGGLTTVNGKLAYVTADDDIYMYYTAA